jgi:hypothetical protein
VDPVYEPRTFHEFHDYNKQNIKYVRMGLKGWGWKVVEMVLAGSNLEMWLYNHTAVTTIVPQGLA